MNAALRVGSSLLSGLLSIPESAANPLSGRIERVRSYALRFAAENKKMLNGILFLAVWKCSILIVALFVYAVVVVKVFPLLGKIAVDAALRTDNYRWICHILKNAEVFDFNRRDAAGETTLHYLARKPDDAGKSACMELILIQGANPNIANHKGQTPLEIAFTRRDNDTTAPTLLCNYGASPEKTNIAHLLSIDELIEFLRPAAIAPDVESPFHPILEELEHLKDEIPGGNVYYTRMLTQADKGTYTVDELNNVLIPETPPQTKFSYTYKMLLAMQELNRIAYQNLITPADTRNAFLENKASQLVFSLTGLITHFELGDSSKIKRGCDMILDAFAKAKAEGTLLEFFKEGFNEANTCFEGRIAHFAKYASREIDPADFIENFQPNASVATKLGEYFRVFRNKQFREMVGLQYASLKTNMHRGALLPNQAEEFYRKYCTKTKFISYVVTYYVGQDLEIITDAAKDTLHFFA